MFAVLEKYNMTEVIPAILVESFEELRERLAKVANLVNVVQIDICDGKFVSHASWPLSELRSDRSTDAIDKILNEEEGLPFWDSIDFEFDLMVLNAHLQFELFTRLGAKRIIFHLEAEGEIIKFKEFLEGLDMYLRESVQIGVAINTTTPITDLDPIISNIDFVQCMGIEHIGQQGEPFDERVLDQIKGLRSSYPELIISVDGSVNEFTAPQLVEAGANRLVVGSALISSLDVRETIRDLENL
jgi:ribulose-phosphate 3-epimerase